MSSPQFLQLRMPDHDHEYVYIMYCVTFISYRAS